MTFFAVLVNTLEGDVEQVTSQKGSTIFFRMQREAFIERVTFAAK